MFHIIKYAILALFLAAFAIFFISNAHLDIALKFTVPSLLDRTLPPLYINYLLLIAFCVGVVFASLIGAFRMRSVKQKKEELKASREEAKDDVSIP